MKIPNGDLISNHVMNSESLPNVFRSIPISMHVFEQSTVHELNHLARSLLQS